MVHPLTCTHFQGCYFIFNIVYYYSNFCVGMQSFLLLVLHHNFLGSTCSDQNCKDLGVTILEPKTSQNLETEIVYLSTTNPRRSWNHATLKKVNDIGIFSIYNFTKLINRWNLLDKKAKIILKSNLDQLEQKSCCWFYIGLKK